jgi:hypothetical protein
MVHSIIHELIGRVQGYDVMQLITALLITSFPASRAANFACCWQKIMTVPRSRCFSSSTFYLLN